MKFNKLVLGSALALSTFGLLACSDDSSSNASDEPGSSASVYVPPTVSAVSPIVFNSLSVKTMQANGVLAGSLGGIIELDMNFVDPNVTYTGNASTKIDGVAFTVGKNVDGKIVKEDISIDLTGAITPDRVNLSQKSFPYAQLSSCGEYKLYVEVTASTMEEGFPTTSYTSLDSAVFSRPESECAAPEIESSSSEPVAACTELTAQTITLTNSLGTDQFALNLETGTAENPDFSIKFDGGDAIIVPSAGVSVVEEDNTQSPGQIPAAPICLENFKASTFPVDELNQNLWVVVTTASGKMYPMMIGKIKSESSTKGSVEITYFK